jgi:biopolymer transport protein ExbD
MKSTLGMCLFTLLIACAASAQQDPTKPTLREGISVQMPVSSQATQMREADDENATVIAVTADGNSFVGVQPAQLSTLSQLNAATVYVKADARVPYQKLLAVLDALRGHSVVLLTSSPSSNQTSQITWPYGVKVTLGGQ